MSNTATKRMQMIADDLADEGFYTRAASVYECALERDALYKLVDRIEIICTCEASGAKAIQGIRDEINEHRKERADGKL